MATTQANGADGTNNAAPAGRGIPGIRCPHCGSEDSVALGLDNGIVFCRENECELDADDIRAHISQWQAVLRVLEALPPLPQ